MTGRRAELVAAAAELVGERGWSGLRMQPIADRVGVSRQTVYAEFGTKDGLVAAIALHVADHLIDRAEAAILAATSIREGWETALRAALDAAAAHPAMARALDSADDGGFIRQFVGERPVIERAQTRLTPTFQRKWPKADTAQLDIAIEAAIRLTISHFLLPLHAPADAAAQTAALLARATPSLDPAEERAARTVRRVTR